MLTKYVTSWLLICLMLSVSACSQNDTSGRGPYLQNASSTTMVIRWRSYLDALGQVNYGINSGELTQVALSAEVSIDQEVLLVRDPEAVVRGTVEGDSNEGGRGQQILHAIGDDAEVAGHERSKPAAYTHPKVELQDIERARDARGIIRAEPTAFFSQGQ